jgi:hypothetical protein
LFVYHEFSLGDNRLLLCVDRATILQHETSKIGKVNTESLAKPAIMRAGADGEYFAV